jgi:UDP-N-acetylmuramate--alanine ligase
MRKTGSEGTVPPAGSGRGGAGLRPAQAAARQGREGPPFEGRRLWFAGIGGAGMSALALVTRALGAEVGGWDRVETPYLAALPGVPVTIAPEPPRPPEGAEVITTGHHARQVPPGRWRGELLAELVTQRPSIVVAGAHGKTTTAAMIAFCLDRLGLDPTFLIGGLVPQLGGNARAGDGYLVAEGDESDRTLALLEAEIGVLTNVELDHHSEFASRAEVEELFERWIGGVAKPVRADELEPVDLELAVPGEHNRRNAAAALAALELAGVDRAAAEGVIVEFAGVERRLELRGEVAGAAIYDDYAHHSTEIAATLAAARTLRPDGRILVLFQPHLYSRTRHLARELASALASADAVCVTEIYPAREDPIEGVSAKLVVDALSEVRPGFSPCWAPGLEDAAGLLRRRMRSGDIVITIGAGDVERAVPLLLG